MGPICASSLDHYLAPLRPILDDHSVTELCINRPHEAFIETRSGWVKAALPAATFGWCIGLAKLVASFTKQRIDEESPLLSATLPSGERIQMIIPPATVSGRVAIAIRRPSDEEWRLVDLADAGLFAECRPAGVAVSPVDAELSRLHAAGEFAGFLRLAVRARKNILVSGATGSGKTTLTRALIAEIPAEERLISIEDAAELSLATHANSVRLFYSKDGQGLAKVTAKLLLESCLRLRPDRILLAELRGEEAYHYLRNVNSGHPGSITSVHASSAALAFEQLTLLVKESVAGREMKREEILAMLRATVDVVVQCGVERQKRTVREVWWRG